ncbi:CbtB-domain containing protein [Streptomyces sp. NPDC019396]|uniref:CbtB domain-containing protein n=1 Tax=Streptomyces sp. NPDC019396 TaxID=3154687 RepID=UPI0033FEDC93
MAQSAITPAEIPVSQPVVAKLPVRVVAPWAAFFGLLMLVLLYFVGAEQGAFSVFSGEGVHEWVHDGRHLLGFPCH